MMTSDSSAGSMPARSTAALSATAAQLRRRDAAQAALELADGRARRAEDDDVVGMV